MFMRLCCTSLMTLLLCCSLLWKFTVLSAWRGCVFCDGPVLTDRLGHLSSSMRLSEASGMSSPGVPSSSESARKAILNMFLPSSLSPSFILRISCAEAGGAILGFIFGVGYWVFLLVFLNLTSLCIWANSLSMLLDSHCISVSSCVFFP